MLPPDWASYLEGPHEEQQPQPQQRPRPQLQLSASGCHCWLVSKPRLAPTPDTSRHRLPLAGRWFPKDSGRLATTLRALELPGCQIRWGQRLCTPLRAEPCASHSGHARPRIDVPGMSCWAAVMSCCQPWQPSLLTRRSSSSHTLKITPSTSLHPSPSCPAPQRPPRGADPAGRPHPALPGSQLPAGAARQPGPPAGPGGPQVGSMMRCFALRFDQQLCIEPQPPAGPGGPQVGSRACFALVIESFALNDRGREAP